MKPPRSLLAILALCASAIAAHAADRTPAMPIETALKIAQDYLKGKGEPRAIVALSLEQATLRGETYWYAKWSAPIPGGDRPELGLQIDMKGGLTKIVGGGAVPGVGQRRFGARNMR